MNLSYIARKLEKLRPNPYLKSSSEYYERKLDIKIIRKNVNGLSMYIIDQDSILYRFYFMGEYEKKSFYQIASVGDSLFKDKKSRLLCLKKADRVKKICWEIKIPEDFK